MKKVIIYKTPSCHFCKEAAEWLAKHDIVPTLIDVSTDLESRKEMIEKSGQMGVPVIVVDDKDLVVGFNKKVLSELLNIKE